MDFFCFSIQYYVRAFSVWKPIANEIRHLSIPLLKWSRTMRSYVNFAVTVNFLDHHDLFTVYRNAVLLYYNLHVQRYHIVDESIRKQLNSSKYLWFKSSFACVMELFGSRIAAFIGLAQSWTAWDQIYDILLLTVCSWKNDFSCRKVIFYQNKTNHNIWQHLIGRVTLKTMVTRRAAPRTNSTLCRL